MKTLYLLRHAQAESPSSAETDFERPLTAAGMSAARRVGSALAARGARPDGVLCSAARRAVQTWEAMAPSFAGDPGPQVLRGLYLAPPSRLVAALRRLPNGRASALLIAHNPGIHSLVLALAGPAVDAPAMAGLRADYPPATLSVFDVAVDTWAALALGAGKLSHVFSPSDLA